MEWLHAFPVRNPERIKCRKTTAVRKTKLSDVAAARQIHHLKETIAERICFPALPPGFRTGRMISFCHGEFTAFVSRVGPPLGAAWPVPPCGTGPTAHIKTLSAPSKANLRASSSPYELAAPQALSNTLSEASAIGDARLNICGSGRHDDCTNLRAHSTANFAPSMGS